MFQDFWIVLLQYNAQINPTLGSQLSALLKRKNLNIMFNALDYQIETSVVILWNKQEAELQNTKQPVSI